MERTKSEAANRISPNVTRASRCGLAYEEVTCDMSKPGYIKKSLFHQLTSAYSGSPKERRKTSPFSL